MATSIFQTQGLDHVSLTVADGQRTIDFYRPIFGQEIYLRPNTQAEFRISLSGTPYLAVNPGRNFKPGTIDHLCIGVKDTTERIDSVLAQEGITVTDGSYVSDQDRTIIQILESADINPAKSILRYAKTPSVAGLQPIVRPRGLDQVTVTVMNLDRSAGFYRKLCGQEMQRKDEQLVFKIGQGTLILREASPGEQPGIDHFRVLVERYDHADAARRMKMLGVELHPEDGDDTPHFVDRDGITVYLAEA